MSKKTKTLDDLTPAQFFEKVRKQWAVDDEPGLSILRTAAHCLGEVQTYQGFVREKGAILPDRWGQLKMNPACQLLKESRAHFLQAIKALGLDLETLENGSDAKKA